MGGDINESTAARLCEIAIEGDAPRRVEWTDNLNRVRQKIAGTYVEQGNDEEEEDEGEGERRGDWERVLRAFINNEPLR